VSNLSREDVMKCAVSQARLRYGAKNSIEIDDNANASVVDDRVDGFFLQAWVWVPLNDIEGADKSDIKNLYSIHRKDKTLCGK